MNIGSFFGKGKQSKRWSPEQVILLELMSHYREELQTHDLSIQSFNSIVKKYGLINTLQNYVLNKTCINTEAGMCSMNFPTLYEEWEKDIEPGYFESGVQFVMTIDNWREVISEQEFIWLIEDTCRMHLDRNSEDTEKIQELLKKVREVFGG